MNCNKSKFFVIYAASSSPSVTGCFETTQATPIDAVARFMAAKEGASEYFVKSVFCAN